MASKQTRKSISVTGDAYWALKARCEKDGTSMSGVCEGLIRDFLELPQRDRDAKVATMPARAAKPVVVTAKELAPETAWKPAPVSRVEAIKEVADRIEARKDEPVKKPGILPVDMASKIFTF